MSESIALSSLLTITSTLPRITKMDKRLPKILFAFGIIVLVGAVVGLGLGCAASQGYIHGCAFLANHKWIFIAGCVEGAVITGMAGAAWFCVHKRAKVISKAIMTILQSNPGTNFTFSVDNEHVQTVFDLHKAQNTFSITIPGKKIYFFTYLPLPS